MAVDESGLMAVVLKYSPLLAVFMAGVGWVGRGFKLVGRLDEIEAAQERERAVRAAADGRIFALERLVADVTISVAQIEQAVHPLEGLMTAINSLREDLAFLKGEIKGAKGMRGQ